MPLISDSQIPNVALDFMNNDHAEAATLINQLSLLLDQAIEQGLTEVLCSMITDTLQQVNQHSQAHFAREEAEMLRTGFPAYGCHKSEHERVLSELTAVISLWQQQADLAQLIHYVRHTLPQWLGSHIATMDTVTAMFITRYDLSAA